MDPLKYVLRKKTQKKEKTYGTSSSNLDNSSSTLGGGSSHSVGGSSRRSRKSTKSTRRRSSGLNSSNHSGSGGSQRRLSVFGSDAARRPLAGSLQQKDAPSEMEILQQLHPADMIAVLERRASVQDMEGDARSFFAMMKMGDFSEQFEEEEDD